MIGPARAPSPTAEETTERVDDQQRRLSEIERNALPRSVIASQALEGVCISYDDAAQLLDEVLAEPLVDLR
ncbi:MAG: hypothetical protein M3Y58_17150 [Chloroflexota bacterium]|nr:hypothetical protein [Chloroflexota bacterium]